MEGAVPQPLHCPDFRFTPLRYWTFPEGSRRSQWRQADSHGLWRIRSKCFSSKCCLYPLPSYTNIYYKVERALRLVATGTLTIDMINAAKGKTVNLPKTMNLATAKESMRQTGFSDVAWGKATHNYAKSAHSLMSTLPLYTRISMFSMIYNIRATFGSIIRLGQYCRTCFEPLAIYTMSFRPFPIISDVLQCFYGISNVCLLISDLSLHRWTIYASPIL